MTQQEFESKMHHARRMRDLGNRPGYYTGVFAGACGASFTVRSLVRRRNTRNGCGSYTIPTRHDRNAGGAT